MLCLGFEPWNAEWLALIIPLSYCDVWFFSCERSNEGQLYSRIDLKSRPDLDKVVHSKMQVVLRTFLLRSFTSLRKIKPLMCFHRKNYPRFKSMF